MRFRMYHWLFAEFMSYPRHPDPMIMGANINQICRLLAKARCLQSLKLIWTETTNHWQLDPDEEPESLMTRFWKSHINIIVQPLTTIQPSCTIRKSDIVVTNVHSRGPFRPASGPASGRATDMENAFSSTIDELIATRATYARE